jgi:hypothetical protein
MFNYVKFARRLSAAILASAFLLSVLACASTPKEKTDELDGTDWKWNITDNAYERYKFRAGKYNYSTSSIDTESGTYTIDGDKIFMVRDDGREKLFPYVFSEDRQSFHRENESDKFSFKREKTWAEIFGGKKKNADG